MKVLSIGNSFSQDAQRYLNGAAKADGSDVYCVNLYIGGCPLSAHYKNLKDNTAGYDLEILGHSGEDCEKISVQKALGLEKWDIVTLQQASHESYDFKTYMPYISSIADCIRANSKAKIFIHQTWGYETGSEKIAQTGFKTYAEMFEKVRSAYFAAAKEINASGIIPSGEAVYNLQKMGISKTHRDGFHLDLGVGRYTAALVWYGILTGNDVRLNKFDDFDVPVSKKETNSAKEAAFKAINEYKDRALY